MRKYRRSLLLLLMLYLGVHNGYIALWESNDPQPRQVFPYRVESYPAADQKALADGIPVTDPARLRQLLEDLTS